MGEGQPRLWTHSQHVLGRWDGGGRVSPDDGDGECMLALMQSQVKCSSWLSQSRLGSQSLGLRHDS